jgi:hypothetical protein
MSQPQFNTVPLSSNATSLNVAKRGYYTPTLVRFGSITDLTQAVGNMGNLDGGDSPTHKTQA